MAKVLLFVYGTLKKDCPCHYLIQSETYLGKCRTTPSYLLYNYKGAACLKFNASRPGKSIKGELYEVDTDFMPFIDKFEGQEYRKQLIKIKEHPDKEILTHFYDHYLPVNDHSLVQDCGTEFIFEDMESVI